MGRGERAVLRRIQETRINLKTGVVVIAIALLIWAAVVYINIRDFVPPELQGPVDSTATR